MKLKSYNLSKETTPKQTKTNTKQNKTKQNKTKQNKSKQNKTKQNKNIFIGWLSEDTIQYLKKKHYLILFTLHVRYLMDIQMDTSSIKL